MSDDIDDQDVDWVPALVEQPDQFDGAIDGEFSDERYGRVSGNTRPSIHYVNESGLPEDVIERHFRRGKGMHEVASIIEKWSQSLSLSPVTQTIDVFNRNRGLEDKLHVHAVMARTAWAVENDDVLSTLADVLEGLMWQKCRFELIDEDQQDVWNQWAKLVNLDHQLRKMGREELKVSQFYVGLWWARKVFSVQEDQISTRVEEFELERKKAEREEQVEARDAFIAANQNTEGYVAPPEIPEVPETKGKGNRKRKKKFPLTIPTEMTIFDPTKIMPVGTTMFGRERFAYIATNEEEQAFTQVMAGDVADDTVLQLIERKYQPTGQDKAACAEVGVSWERLWLMKKDAVFRHTLTKADYERWAPVRLKTILPILEMKGHLRNSDRAALIGNTNFIVVITKGSDKLPAKPSEIQNLQEQARMIARLPVLVGDHRLNVTIVAPSMDKTLQDSRWQLLDARLVFKALNTYAPVTQGGNASGTGVSEMSRVIGKGLESRRHMIMRSLEKHIFAKVLERNEGVIDEFPSVEFSPKRITLDFNAEIINGVLKLRDRGDISRETTLEELDYDQDIEVLRRGRERVLYDKVFGSVTPHSSPVANPYGAPGQATPGVTPPQLPPGGNQNVVGNGGSPAAGGKAGSNVGPNGQPRTEGGRPPGVTETQPRKSR